MIDTTAATAAPTQSPAANGAGWNNTDVTVTWNWTDDPGGSGIDPASCTTASTSSGQGTILLTATCNDLAGNTGDASYTVKVDTTKPVLTVSANVTVNATSPAGATVSYTAATATDTGGSGVESVGCSPLSHTVFAVGDTTVNCSATDVAGNTQTDSFTVHVNAAAEQLSALVTQVTGVGPGKSLANKVTQIEGYVEANNTASACTKLDSFISKVAAQAGKKLGEAQAAPFTAQANTIKAALGCKPNSACLWWGGALRAKTAT